MKQFVETIVKDLVQKPEQMRVEQRETPEGIQLLIYVAPEDAGLIIGKKGFVIRAIRQLVSILATKQGVKAGVEVVPLGEPPMVEVPA
jgi:hypothetical protein